MYRKALKALTVAAVLLGTSTAGAGVAISQMPAPPAVVPQAAAAQPALYVPVTPTRLLDTRDGTGGTFGAVGAGGTITFQAAGVAGVPANATSVVLNVTAVDASAPSYLTIWPADQPRPFASSLNPQPRQGPTPNAVTTGVSSGGAVAVFNAVGNVHVVADIAGYYIPAGDTAVGLSNRGAFTATYANASDSVSADYAVYQVVLPAGHWHADYNLDIDIPALPVAGRAGVSCSVDYPASETGVSFQSVVASSAQTLTNFTNISGSGAFTLTEAGTVTVSCYSFRSTALVGTTAGGASTLYPAEGSVRFTPVNFEDVTDYLPATADSSTSERDLAG